VISLEEGVGEGAGTIHFTESGKDKEKLGRARTKGEY